MNLDLPTRWTVLELSRWREQLAGSPEVLALPADSRACAVELVADIVDDARERGVAVLAVHPRRQDDGGTFSASLTVG